MQQTNQQKPMHIDVDTLLRQRLPRHYRYIPRCVVRWLARTVRQDELNGVLQAVGDKHGVEAVDRALEHMGIKLQVTGLENIPAEGRFVMVSNHPLGGLDGLALISLMGHRYGYDGIRFMVNDLLMAVEPLRGIFLPINKFGRQSRQAATQIEQEWAGNRQMLTFPAGLCSRMMPDGSIHDLTWQKFFVTRAIAHHRDVVPIYFDAHNSRFFYRLAKFRAKLKLKFNVEMIYLPSEMMKCRNTTLHIHIGKPVKWTTLDAAHPAAEASRLCGLAYDLVAGNGLQQSAAHVEC